MTKINTQKSFILDLNRCTGCGACIVACSIHNYGKQDLAWRDIHTYNETHHPCLPQFNLSMACNHCEDPSCSKNCPTHAYTKDEETGAVIIDPDKCIGCKFCTWACPYDAPRYFKKKGVIQKCDFCIDRLKNDEFPACVVACPTNALSLQELIIAKREEINIEKIPGFTDTKILPAIRFKNLRTRNQIPEMTAPPIKSKIRDLFESSLNSPPKKIQLRSEWTLLLFTTITSILVGFMAAYANMPEQISPFLFLSSGISAMILSTIHLGQKLRAYRAIYNFSRSWLSREILSFSLFMGLGAIYILYFPQQKYLGIITTGIGFFCLYSIDRLYQVAMNVSPLNFHSAHALLNGIYLMGIISANLEIAASMTIIKLFLYLHRKYYFWKIAKTIRPIVSLFRIISGFITPVFYFLAKYSDHNTYLLYLLIIIIIGEFIDRMEYYDELDIITPKKQMLNDLKDAIS